MNTVILGNGLLGSELKRQTQWHIISREQDKIDFSILKDWNYKLEPYDTIINCIANTNTYQASKKECWKINFEGVANLVDYCNIQHKKLVHISTDYVYANSSDIPTEEDVPVHQETHYAHTKLLADGYIELRAKQFLLLRGTHKRKPFPYENAWDDHKGNFDYVDNIANIIIALIKTGKTGVYNIGTPTKTMFELAKQTKPQVQPIKRHHTLIPQSVEMDLSKLNKALNNT